jgi:rod shape-determining protein MreD
MASKSTTFWTFIVILVLLHLSVRLALGVALLPDLLVVALLLGARRLGAWQAALFGLVLGILADSLALVAFGATSVAFVVVAYLGSRSRNFFEGDSYLFVIAYAFFGAWLIDVIRFIAGGFMKRGVETGYLITQAPLTSLYIAVAAVVSLIAYRGITGQR